MIAARRKARALPIALGLAAIGTVASAETSPWYLGASQTFGYDSNVFRRPDNGVEITLPDGSTTRVLKPESSGTISTTRLLGGFDINPSRQHVYANVSVDSTRYGNQPQLDSNGYGIAGGIDWETMERLSGVVKISADRRPGNYADPQVPSGTGRVLDEPVRADFIFRLGDYKQSRLWLEAGYFYTRTKNTVDFGTELQFLGVQAEGYDRTIPTDAVSAGVRYRVGADIVLGADLRYEKGDEDYALRLPGGAVDTRFYNSYDRQDVDVIARWTASGASSLNARLSYTRTDNSGTLQRTDYSGPTAAMIWEWQATGKLHSTARVSYDTDIRAETLGTTTNPAWSLGWDLAWAVTSKINATAGLQWSKRDLEGQLVADQHTGANIGFTYAALRNVNLQCSLAYESRSGAGVRRDYAANLTSCSVQAFLR